MNDPALIPAPNRRAADLKASTLSTAASAASKLTSVPLRQFRANIKSPRSSADLLPRLKMSCVTGAFDANHDISDLAGASVGKAAGVNRRSSRSAFWGFYVNEAAQQILQVIVMLAVAAVYLPCAGDTLRGARFGNGLMPTASRHQPDFDVSPSMTISKHSVSGEFRLNRTAQRG
jgi:hypothetical protein